MRIVIATNGTTGDVQPLLALTLELKLRGHGVKLGAPPDFEKRAANLGVDFVSLGPPMDPCELRNVYGRNSLSGDVVAHIQRTLPFVVRDTPQMIADLKTVCTDADVLLSLPYQLAGQFVHELLGVPFASVHFSPFGGYSRRFAAEGARIINELRCSYGLAPLGDPLGEDGVSPTLALYAVSPEMFPSPRRWAGHRKITGFWFLDERWEPDAGLKQFLESGPPPVVISLGSVLHVDPQTLSKSVLEALRHTGSRAIVQRGWSGLDLCDGEPNILQSDFIPHSWLFPRAACVVHAGGAGTTAATVRAGVPSIPVPHVLDQFLWGALLQEQGCAVDVIPFTELTATRLARALEQIEASDRGRNARTLAAKISCENGVSAAADAIEECFQPKQTA